MGIFGRVITATFIASAGVAAAEPLELSAFFLNWDGTPYDSETPVALRAQERTGVRLRFTAEGSNMEDYPGEAVIYNSTKIYENLVRYGKLPDIIAGPSADRVFRHFGPRGAFVELDQLIVDHAPNLSAFFERRPELRAASLSDDGKLHHIPFFPEGVATVGYFIRHDWLDTLGLDVPQTVDAYYEVLRAFRTQDPNGNGVMDEIPLYFRTFREFLKLAPMFDARTTSSREQIGFFIDDNRVAFGFTRPEYRNFIREMAKWYEEDLLEKGLFEEEHYGDEREELLRADLVGATLDWFGSTARLNETLEEAVPGFDYRPILPPESRSGVRLIEGNRGQVPHAGWAISFTNPHPVETIKYFDFWFSPEGDRLANFGVEGVHHVMQDGAPQLSAIILDDEDAVPLRLHEIGVQIPRGARQDYEAERQWTNRIAQAGIDAYREAGVIASHFHPQSMREDEVLLFRLYWPTISRYIISQTKRWVRGDGDIDAEWDAYLATLNDLRVPAVLEQINNGRWRQIYIR